MFLSFFPDMISPKLLAILKFTNVLVLLWHCSKETWTYCSLLSLWSTISRTTQEDRLHLSSWAWTLKRAMHYKHGHWSWEIEIYITHTEVIKLKHFPLSFINMPVEMGRRWRRYRYDLLGRNVNKGTSVWIFFCKW